MHSLSLIIKPVCYAIGMVSLLSSCLQLPGDAVHGHRPRKADEAGEIIRGQSAVSHLSDAERTQGGHLKDIYNNV